MENKRQVKHSGNERKKATREERLRGYFDRMFGTNEQSKNLEKLMFFIRWGLFVSLVIVELLVLVEHLELFLKHGRALEFAFLAFLLFVLLTSEIAKMTMKFDDSTKHVFYMAEAGAACGINVLAGGSYALALYVLVLTQFYFST